MVIMSDLFSSIRLMFERQDVCARRRRRGQDKEYMSREKKRHRQEK